MHYHAEVWMPKNPGTSPSEIDAMLEELLEPYGQESHSRARNKFYDWYQVGGRYTGRHDDYHPWEDPRNYEVCDLCNGTGIRTDGKSSRSPPDG